MFKMEIRFNREILEAEGYNYEKTMKLLCDGMEKAGFIKEVCEEAHIIYRGTDSPKDFSYMGLVYKGLAHEQWFKNCVTEWNLLENELSNDGSFASSSYIEGMKECGVW